MNKFREERIKEGDIYMFSNKMKIHVKQQYFEDDEDFEQYKIDVRTSLEYVLEKHSDLYYKNKGCVHKEFNKPTYTFQRRVIGYVFVYERVCKCCGYVEHKTVDEPKDKPEWAEQATERFYNNSI